MKEKWRNLNYENIIQDKYEVSNMGNFRIKKTKKLLKTSKSKGGYYIINLKTTTSWKVFNAHVLIISSFKFLRRLEQTTVNHIDGDKSNNTLENLEWATYKEQILHAYKNGLKETKYSEEFIHTICKLLAKGYKRKQIAIILDIKNDKTFKCLVGNIINRSSWFDISSLYNLQSNYIKKCGNYKFTESNIEDICKCFQKGIFSPDIISNKIGVINNKSFKDLIRLVKLRKTWKSISKNYFW